ncbi:MAG: hypothetical protein J0H82_30025 [Alphaproteobacteria bacterium]|jgi:hypothetical protein|nr:hypothetical protein [Alphaproteobacteria bacterium]
MDRPAAYVIKAPIADRAAEIFDFVRQRTMYGGKMIAAGDSVFLFDSETRGGCGLIARGVAITARAIPPRTGVARQTPLVDVSVRCLAPARRPLGRGDLKPFTDWEDGRPETELNFKFYRQATDKIGGISPAAATFLARFF